MLKPSLVRIDFACNDPDNGLFAGRVGAIQLYDVDPIFELESTTSGDRAFAIEMSAIRVSGKSFPFHERRSWVGNWCWEGFWMDVCEVERMLVWLRRPRSSERRLFELTTGTSLLVHDWRAPGPFGGPYLRQLLIDAGKHQAGER
jgi:hypothetical protein